MILISWSLAIQVKCISSPMKISLGILVIIINITFNALANKQFSVNCANISVCCFKHHSIYQSFFGHYALSIKIAGLSFIAQFFSIFITCSSNIDKKVLLH